MSANSEELDVIAPGIANLEIAGGPPERVQWTRHGAAVCLFEIGLNSRPC